MDTGMNIDGKKHRTVQGMIEDIEAELVEWKQTRASLKRMGKELSQDSLRLVSGLVGRLERLRPLPPGKWVPIDF